MEFQIKNSPDYASLHVELNLGEQVVTESGAMMGMSTELEISSNMKGGLFGAAKRMLGGESVFLNTYTATGSRQRLDIAPAMPGDLKHMRLDGGAIKVQSGCFCASTVGVELDTKWAGGKGFFGGTGLVMLNCHGVGDLWLSSYGAIHEEQVSGSFVLDTNHIVAFEDTLDFKVRKVGGLKSLFLSGEGLVCEFSGHGKLWYQTRSVDSLASFLHPFRRVKPKSNKGS
jgi:uncharacterized protein (TIGR00266 family)